MAVNAFGTGKPNLTSVVSVLDPMLSDNFRLEFEALPSQVQGVDTGGGNTVPESLIIQCRTAAKPGSQLEVVPVELFGHSVQYAGRLTFSHSMSIEYVEDRRAIITRSLETWQRVARTVERQHGSFKKSKGQGYCTDGILYVYDQEGNITTQFTIYNMWPSDVPDISFDGSAANLITAGVTFTYDYFKSKDEQEATA